MPATTRSGKPSAPCLDSNSCAVEKEETPISELCCALGPPCPVASGGMQVLTGLTCASQVCPALRAHRGDSAAAPPGFLHLQEGSGATETTREGFSLVFPPPSALLSKQGVGAHVVEPSQSFPQHQGALGPPRPSLPLPCVPTKGDDPHQNMFPCSSPTASSLPLRRLSWDVGWGLTHLLQSCHCPQGTQPAPARPCLAPEKHKSAVGANLSLVLHSIPKRPAQRGWGPG